MSLSTDIQEAKQGLLDFHTHSTFSDGADTPTEVVMKAKQTGVSALALTDHNVIGGLEEFNYACKEQGIFAIPFGTEIHAALPPEILQPEDNDAPDLVILGKNAQPDEIKEYQALLEKDRAERFIPETLEKLREIGFYIPKKIEKDANGDLLLEWETTMDELKDWYIQKSPS